MSDSKKFVLLEGGDAVAPASKSRFSRKAVVAVALVCVVAIVTGCVVGIHQHHAVGKMSIRGPDGKEITIGGVVPQKRIDPMVIFVLLLILILIYYFLFDVFK
jgi:hypothetical protein